MTEHDIMLEGRIAFSSYASGAFDSRLTDHDPLYELATLQARLAAWQGRNFGAQPLVNQVLGVCEEAGELAHAALKHEQGIRGMKDPDKHAAKACDALADLMVYAMQVATILRVDLLTVFILTAREVLKRDWVADPDGGAPKEYEWISKLNAQQAQPKPEDHKEDGDDGDEEEERDPREPYYGSEG